MSKPGDIIWQSEWLPVDRTVRRLQAMHVPVIITGLDEAGIVKYETYKAPKASVGEWIAEHRRYDGVAGVWRLSSLEISLDSIDVADLIVRGWQLDPYHDGMKYDRGF